MTMEAEVIWVEPLPPGTSAQRAELVALTKALTLGQGKRATIYVDSRYAFATAHIHGTIYKERGLLTAEGKPIKNKDEIVGLLAALLAGHRLLSGTSERKWPCSQREQPGREDSQGGGNGSPSGSASEGTRPWAEPSARWACIYPKSP